MSWYLIVKTIHILNSTVLFGTGLGIAFFMFRCRFTDHPQERYYAATNTVLADYLFTLPAVIVQPLSGAWLVWKSGYQWTDTWLVWTYALYILAGLCWLPVVWIQRRLKQLAADALRNEKELPDNYHRLFGYWMLLGWPAFVSLVLIFFLMVFRPT